MSVADPRSRLAERITTHEIDVVAPYRLDLTVSALRRMATNVVDVYTADGRYLRAFQGAADPVVVEVTQPRPDALAVTVTGGPGDTDRAVANVRRMLGTERDITSFHRRAGGIPWLAPLARRMRGLRPPRYPELFESFASAIVFQQLSLHAASAIMHRLVIETGTPVDHGGVPLAIFPSAAAFLEADEARLRSTGLSAAKRATLRRVAEAIVAGAISETLLDERSSTEAGSLLRGIKGIGPWTAALILIRGLGRLDVFPGNDSSVTANLALVAGEPVEVGPALETLGSQRGMLYFCLLLARLDARAEIGRVHPG